MSEQTYQKILSFYYANRRMPSYAEISRLLGFKSKNAAYKVIRTMIASGMLEKDDKGKIIPKQLMLPLKLLGTVEAGFPSPAEEELSDTMSLDEYLIEHPEATYLLKVQGDSMIDAGIMPGDMLLVERATEAKDGDIVVAEVDHAWTMKYFHKEKGKVMLVPGNKKYPVITPREELRIAAIVKAVVRKY